MILLNTQNNTFYYFFLFTFYNVIIIPSCSSAMQLFTIEVIYVVTNHVNNIFKFPIFTYLQVYKLFLICVYFLVFILKMSNLEKSFNNKHQHNLSVVDFCLFNVSPQNTLALALSMSFTICTQSFLSNHWQVNCRQPDISSLNCQQDSSKNKTIFPPDHSTLLHPQDLMLTQSYYLMYSPFSTYLN